jgi:hypothetical protein
MFTCSVNTTNTHLRYMMGSGLRGGARISSSYLCAGRRGVLQDSRASITARKNFGSGRFEAFSAIRREGTSSDWCTEYSLFY